MTPCSRVEICKLPYSGRKLTYFLSLDLEHPHPVETRRVVKILVGVHHGCCSRAVIRGLDRCVLDGVNARSLAGFGWESFAWVRYTGFTDGDLPMTSIPGAHTGDGRFDGETFLGGLLIFFLGGRGRGRGAPGCVWLRGFSLDERTPSRRV
jgi:hypothetical protein